MPAPAAADLIDLVDDNDRPIGTIPRGSVPAPGVGFRVAHVLVLNHDDELLLQQVGHARDRSPLKWGSSVAGYVFAGESYRVAAGRRAYEELGIPGPVRLIGRTEMEDAGAHKFISVFLADLEQVPQILEPDHIEAVEFMPLDAIRYRLGASPADFTETFPFVFEVLEQHLRR